MSERRKPVSHPILRLEVLTPEGRQQADVRVFCRERQAAVSVATCCACLHCDGVEMGDAPAVRCRISLDRADLLPDPLGLTTPVGEVLASAMAIEDDTTLREALTFLRSADRRSAPILDRNHVVVGLLHERAAFQSRSAAESEMVVASVMGSRVTLPAGTPIRRALALMAAAHLREIAVVDDAGVPLGVFRDVDGLRWLGRARLP